MALPFTPAPLQVAPSAPPLRTVPPVTIEAGPGPLRGDDMQALVSIRVQAVLSLPTLCELTFTVSPQGGTLTERLTPGDPLRVLIAEAADPLFTGQITAVEYSYDSVRGPQFRVRAYDRLHALRKRQAVRAYTQVRVADLGEEFVRDLGLRVSVEGEDPGPLFNTLIQHEQSNLDFLTELADRCGLYLALRENTLYLVPLSGFGEPVRLRLGEDLIEARVEVNADAVTGTVQTLGWNPRRAESQTGDARTERPAHSVEGVDPDRVSAGSTRWLVNENIEDNRHAEILSQAELDRRAARAVTFSGKASGNPALQPGARVEVSGIAAAVAGRYVLTRVTHLIDSQSGFISELSTIPPVPLPRARTSAVTIGMITQIADPDRLGRVRASLPAFQDAETDWMQVVVPGAGRGKGLLALPEVGDRVLILLPQGNPAMGVVLGGLYGTDAPPDNGMAGDSRLRFSFHTAKGQRIQLDDSKDLLRVENHDGSYLEMAPGKVILHAATDLEIDASGHRIVIRGQKIDFSQG